MTGNGQRPIAILLVEDNPGDARLTKEALLDAKILNRLYHVEDGVEAIAFLKRQGSYGNAPRPDLILLDLNLPKRDGREVLGDIKQNPNLRDIPVVVLTTSASDEDVLQAYSLHVNCYVTKPVDLASFMNVIRSIEEFWLDVVKLPNGGER